MDAELLDHHTRPFVLEIADTKLAFASFPDDELIELPSLDDGFVNVTMIDQADGVTWEGTFAAETRIFTGDGMFKWYRCQVLSGHLELSGTITPKSMPPQL